MDRSFFADLKGYADFHEVLLDAHYHAVPEDWWIVITDVVGSTKAIEAGRYKDVNTVGAATLAVLNKVIPDVDFPFVFGGDGASALIPSEDKESVCTALAGLSAWSESSFGLQLRVGMVQVAEVNAEGTLVTVAKYILSGGYALATFRGGALRNAEEKVKGHPEQYNITPDPSVHVDLKSLSCRWEPLINKNGVILSLLFSDSQDRNDVYTDFLSELQKIVNRDIDEINPVRTAQLQYRSLSDLFTADQKMQTGFWSGVLRKVDSLFASILFGMGVYRWIPILRNYVEKTAAHSDFRKFDDMLRMVIDCTQEEQEEIEALCLQYRKNKGVCYGVFATDRALMTCYLSQFGDGQHIHFIDGGNGGYAMAAKQLKKQMKEQRE
jgi:hypothetical protein